MAIIVDNDTKLVVQGLTGSEGRFHGLRNRAYGTNVVAGVTPGKGGQDVDGIPVFDTVAAAVAEGGANTSLIFVPARFAGDAIYEAVDAGIRTVICITEHIPAHELLRVYTYARPKGVTLVGGSGNDFDYDLYNGQIAAYRGAEKHGIAGVPIYERDFVLARRSPGMPRDDE